MRLRLAVHMRLFPGAPRPFWAELIHRISSKTPITPVKTLSCGSLIRPGQGPVRSSKYLSRALWRQLTGYHHRSRVETNPLGVLLRNTLPGNGCIALNCLIKTSQRVTAIARLRRSKSVLRSLTGSPHLAFPKQSLQTKALWGKGKHDLKLLCETKPFATLPYLFVV